MVSGTILLLVAALIAALFGFGGVAGVVALVAKALFFLFLTLFIASVLMGSKVPRH